MSGDNKGTDHLHAGPSRKERHQMRRAENQKDRARCYAPYRGPIAELQAAAAQLLALDRKLSGPGGDDGDAVSAKAHDAAMDRLERALKAVGA